MQSDAALLPDPAGQPPDAVLSAFADGFEGWSDDEELDTRLRTRALALFEQRRIAADALGAVLALIDWMRRDVLPLASVDLAGTPPAADLAALGELNAALAVCERTAQQRWRDSNDRVGNEDWRIYDLVRDVHRAVMAVQRIPKYRVPEPSWKAKKPRPTPMSLCEDAAGTLAGVFASAVGEWPDAERALDQLGLGGDDSARLRAQRARRGLDALGVDGGVKVLALAERVVVALDATPAGAPDELADRALHGFEPEPVITVAESAYLRSRPLPAAAATLQDGAIALLRELGIRLASTLKDDVPSRRPAARAASQPTPVEAPAVRPTPDDLARRIVLSLERGSRDPRAALVALRKLGAELGEAQQRMVAAAILDQLGSARMSRRVVSYESRAASARLRLGALAGPMIVPLQDRSLVHLWRSGDADDLAAASTLCGIGILAGGPWKRTFDTRLDRDDGDSFGYFNTPCPHCLAAAREARLFPAQAAEPGWPDEVRERAIDIVLTLDTDRDDWEWAGPVDELISGAVRASVTADAERLSVLCAQRTLGPARYLKEQAALTAPLGTGLHAGDWALILDTKDVSVAKRLVELVRERQPGPARGTGRGGAPSWAEHFDALRAFHAEHGHTRVPRTYERDGIKLGAWLRNQRQAAKSAGRTITPQRRARLDALDPLWASGAASTGSPPASCDAGPPRERPALRLVVPAPPPPPDNGGAA